MTKLDKLHNGLRLALLTVSCLGIGLVSLKIAKLADQATSSLVQTQQDLQKVSDEIHGTSQNLNAVLIQLGLTADQARLASMEQRAYWRKNSLETHQVLASVKRTVDDADLGLQVLVVAADKQLNGTGEKLQSSLLHLGNVADDMDRLMLHTDQTLYQAGPSVQATLDNVQKTSASLAAASDSIAGASKDIEVKVHQLTRPAKWWMTVGGAILEKGAQVGQWVVGFFK